MKIAHVSDIHIHKNITRLEEYLTVFENLVSELQKCSPELIVITGDIAHDKLNLQTEQMNLIVTLIRKLLKLAPIRFIRGNHDMNVLTPNREDIMTLLTTIIDDQSLVYLNKTALIEDPLYSDIVWAVWHHPEKIGPWTDFTQKDPLKTYIDLFHDPVQDCKLPYDIKLEGFRPYITTDKFLGDLAFFGDIHKYQSFDNAKKAYAGSLIQQNYGEELTGHGFILWDLPKKSHKFVEVNNPFGFYNLIVDSTENYRKNKYDFKQYPRIRYIWKDYPNNYTSSRQKEIESFFNEFNPIELNCKKEPLIDNKEKAIREEYFDNISSNETQTRIIRDYLEERKYDNSVIEEVLNVDKEVSIKLAIVDNGCLGLKSVKIEKLLINNFMSYGQNVEVNWQDIHGLVDLNAPNRSGKSTLFTALCWGLFGKTLYTGTDKESVFNTVSQEDKVSVEIWFTVNLIPYKITRSIERKKKRDGGYSYSSIQLHYSSITEEGVKELTDEDRLKTDRILIQNLGTYEDFVRNNLITGDILNDYISATNSQITDAVLKDMGIGYYEKKLEAFKEFKEEKLKELPSFKLDIDLTKEELDELIREKQQIELSISKTQEQIVDKENRIKKGNEYRDELLQKLHPIDKQVSSINVDQLVIEIDGLEKGKERLVQEKALVEAQIANLPMSDYDVNVHKQLELEFKKLRQDKLIIENDIRSNDNHIQNIQSEIIKNQSTIDVSDSYKARLKEMALQQVITLKANHENMLKRASVYDEKFHELTNKKHLLITENICSSCSQPINETQVKKQIEELNFELDKTLKNKENFILELDNDLKNKIDSQREKLKNDLLLTEIELKKAQDNCVLLNDQLSEKQSLKESYEQKLEIISFDLSILVDKIEKIEEKKIIHEKQNTTILLLESLPIKIETADSKIKLCHSKIDLYKGIQAKIEDNIKTNELIGSATNRIFLLETEKRELENLLNQNLRIDLFKVDDNIIKISDKIEKFVLIERRDKIYKLYQDIVHREGIPTFLLKKVLPSLNEELSRLLSPFGVGMYFTEDVEIVMENETSKQKQNAKQGSGMERTFMALALKMATRFVNNYVKYNILLLDECTDKLDLDSTELMKELLLQSKRYVDVICIVSHTDRISDICDHRIKIEKKNGISQLTIN